MSVVLSSPNMSKKDQVLVIEPPNELTFTGEIPPSIIYHSTSSGTKKDTQLHMTQRALVGKLSLNYDIFI